MGISACIIVRDEPLLSQAVASIRPYVDEIVIVDTGSEDTSVARSLADVFEVYTECNGSDGRIEDFSKARQRSFDLATNNAVVWIDADDELVIAGKHPNTFRSCEKRSQEMHPDTPCRWIAPYEYTYNESGECVQLQQRERVITDKNAFHWQRGVHEGLVARPGVKTANVKFIDGVVWKHRRIVGPSKDPDRNLRILKKMKAAEEAAGHIEPRTYYDMGVECHLRGIHPAALFNLNVYVEVSGWDAERFQACLRLADLHAFYSNWDKAEEAAQKACDICPEDPAGPFTLAKLSHRQAEGEHEKRFLRRAFVYGKRGMEMPPFKGALIENPQDRTIAIPELLADSADRLGDKKSARKYWNMCLAVRPDDAGMRLRSGRDIEPGKLDIVIACGRTDECWNPDVIAKSGMGGSETAVVEVAKRLALAGHRVRVFCDTPVNGLFDGVEYRDQSYLPEVKHCDLLVGWRDGTTLGYISAKVKWIWVHDTTIANGTPWNLFLAERVLALSQWHAGHLVEKCGAGWEQVSVTSNGIDVSRFTATPERHPHRALYTQSPDRGLEELLKIWPSIKARVPDAELRVFYGWGSAEGQSPSTETGKWLIRVKQLLKDTEHLGVTHHGRVDQATLANEMLSAGVWLYPSWAYQDGGYAFTDTSAIGCMEAQAAGMRLVVGKSGALTETMRVGMFVEPGDFPAFADAAVEALLGNTRPAPKDAAEENFSWDNVSNQWLDWIHNDLLKAKQVEYAKPKKPTLHMVLAPHISGEQPIDPKDPQSVAATGGSRDGYLGLVRAMGKQGDFHVRAYATFKDRHDTHEGVEYVRIDELQNAPKPDVLFAYYDTSPLAWQTGMLRIGSHHTYKPYRHFEWTDVNLAPSTHARETLRARYDPTGEWQTMPNGLEISLARKPVSGRVIYHTSPDRGLHLLLEAWPEIVRRVPHATLHISGNAAKFAADAPGYIDLRQKERAEAVDRGLKKAQEVGGVTLLGKMPRNKLNEELAEAAVFAFPCELLGPCETFSISIMECLAIGLPTVLIPQDALESIYKGSLVLSTKEKFVDDVVAALEGYDEKLIEKGKALAARHTFENEAATLASIINIYNPSYKIPVTG